MDLSLFFHEILLQTWQPLKELNGQTDTCVTRNEQLRDSKEHDRLSKEIRVRREAGWVTETYREPLLPLLLSRTK